MENRRILLGLSGAAVLIISHRIDRNAAEAEQQSKRQLVVEAEAHQENVENFGRFMRFGMVDMSILLMSLVAGVSFDGTIARLIGVKGYGAIVGAGLGNIAADVIAGLPEGLYSAVGVGLGAVVPLIPLAIPMLLKKPLTRPISLAFGASSLGFCILAFVWGYEHHQEQKKESLKVDEQTRVLLVNLEELVSAGEIQSAIQLLEKHQ